MQVVVQRVNRAAVAVDGAVVGEVGLGLMVLVGVGHASTEQDAVWLASKTEGLRIFGDDEGLMNLSVDEVGGSVLAISQFTLYGDASKGRRPSFRHAAEPERGEALYHAYCDALTVPVARGVFGAVMTIDMEAHGPVTILLRRER
ncbi:MAG: D-tyrosyl-tRNA(Tyr) deacylase [Euzebyales bacterium]|jgi:D-tyrosyl-tRNA(Tyr) deacylase|nr:D-tyrosyl-tRNA(Tyr) deacylase [Euzebyales bacterium]